MKFRECSNLSIRVGGPNSAPDWLDGVFGYKLGEYLAVTQEHERTLVTGEWKVKNRKWGVTHLPTGQLFVGGVSKAKGREIARKLAESGLPLDFKDALDDKFADNRSAFAKICRPDLYNKMMKRGEEDKNRGASNKALRDGSSNPTKLGLLLEIEGLDEMELARLCVVDSVIPGICMNPGCDYTTGVEPDSTRGWCEICNSNTVMSGGVLLGLI